MVKAKKAVPAAFALIQDGKEITIIQRQEDIDAANIIEIEPDWKIITFNMVLPFELVGFLAKVTDVLAQAKISVFALSSFSTDHILIKQKDMEKCKQVLEDLGFIFETS